jgi:hypothetical protein
MTPPEAHVHEKLDTSPSANKRVASSEAFALPRDAALDRDRRASMADEGGVAAAEMDLNEQLATSGPQSRLAVWRERKDWRARVLWSALALGVAAVFARALRHSEIRRSRSRRFLHRLTRAW